MEILFGSVGIFPPDLVLGDPGERDAALHAIQACIPHANTFADRR